MPLPLKPGYHFYVDRKCKPSDYEMKQFEIYRDYYGISYTVSGNRKFIMPHMIAFLHAGSVGVTPKNIYHKTSFVDNAPYERFVVKFTDQAIKPLLDIIGEDQFNELYHYPAYTFSPEIQDKIYHIFCDMLDEYEHYSDASDLILRGMLHQLIMTVIRFHLPENPTDIRLEQSDTVILQAMKYLDNNYMNDPSMTETAKYVGLSPSYFSRLFKQALGDTYSEYLNRVKVEKARSLLLSTNLSITNIAQQCGFQNSNYFCNITKKLLGETPSSLRKNTIL